MKEAVEKLVKEVSAVWFRLEKNINLLVGLFEGVEAEPHLTEIITFEESISYFVKKKPDDERVSKGVMLREKNPRGYMFIQAFLDVDGGLITKKNGIPYGRKLLTRGFDKELDERFSNKNMILVE
jgi:hypothetical protein